MGFLDKLVEKQKEHNKKISNKIKDNNDKIKKINEVGSSKLQSISEKNKENKLGEFALDSDRKEIKELNNILLNDEICKYIVFGAIGLKNQIVVITNERVIFLNKNIDVEELFIKDIKFIKGTNGIGLGKVEIALKDNNILIKNINKIYVDEMVKIIKEEKIREFMDENSISYEEANEILENNYKEYEKMQHEKLIEYKEKKKYLKEENKEKKRRLKEKDMEIKRKEFEKIMASSPEISEETKRRIQKTKEAPKELSKRQQEKQYQKERVEQLKRDHVPYCPKCKSTSLTYQNKKLSVGRAVAGGFIMGPVGAAVGGMTSKKGYVKCLNCGHKWKI